MNRDVVMWRHCLEERWKHKRYMTVNLHVAKWMMLVAVLVSTGCGDQDTNTYPAFPPQSNACDYFDKTAEMLEFWLGVDARIAPDVKLKIPREYVDMRVLRRYRTDKLDGALHLLIRVDDFAPYLLKNSKVAVKLDPRPTGGALISPKIKLNENLRRRIEPGGAVDKTDISTLLNSLSTIPELSGLVKVPTRGSFYVYNDVYAHHNDGDVIDYIVCNQKNNQYGEIPNPGCSLYSDFGPIGGQVNFDKDLLGNWPKYRKNLQDFIDCAVIEVKPE